LADETRNENPDTGDLYTRQLPRPAKRVTRAESPKQDAAMTVWLALGNGLAGFAVGLFLHAIPASWWPRWLRDLVGKKG
jgi:hypothetical protein